jgi:hypothetical protein
MAITLREQHTLIESALTEAMEEADVLLEAIMDKDLDKLSKTFTAIEVLLDVLSQEGQKAMQPVYQALATARKSIEQVVSAPGPAIPDALVKKTITGLLWLQGMIIQVFQTLPKLMRIVATDINRQIPKTEGKMTSLKHKYLIENIEIMPVGDFLSLSEGVDDIDLGGGGDDIGVDDGSEPEEPEKTIRLGVLARRLAKQSGNQSKKGGKRTPEFDRFLKNKLYPALKQLGITRTGDSVPVPESVGQQLHNAVMELEPEGVPASTEDRNTSRATTEEETLGLDSPVWSHLGDKQKMAKQMIMNAMKPKGFFGKIKSALGGDEKALGLDPEAFATGILKLPIKDFRALADKAGTIKMQLDQAKAQEIAKSASGKSATDQAMSGRKLSVGKLKGALAKKGIKGQAASAISNFFGGLVGKGAIEFTN